MLKNHTTASTNLCLSLEDTAVLKGFFVILVLLHHLNQNIGLLKGTLSDTFMQTLGYLSVSIFLFLSGYGLTVSYFKKGSGYIKSFPKNKILPLYIYNLILIAIYFLHWYIIGESLPTARIVLSFTFGQTVIKYGWYIQTTLFLYLLFYFTYKLQNKNVRKIIFVVGYFLYFCLCRINNCWSMWYVSVFAFAAGILYAHFSTNAYNKYLYSSILTVLFLISYILGNFVLSNENLTSVFKMCSAVLFPLVIIKFKRLLPFKFSILKRISKISFEIYVSQGLFITLFHSKIIYIQNEFLYIIAVVASTILFAILLNKLFSKIMF